MGVYQNKEQLSEFTIWYTILGLNLTMKTLILSTALTLLASSANATVLNPSEYLNLDNSGDKVEVSYKRNERYRRRHEQKRNRTRRASTSSHEVSMLFRTTPSLTTHSQIFTKPERKAKEISESSNSYALLLMFFTTFLVPFSSKNNLNK